MPPLRVASPCHDLENSLAIRTSLCKNMHLYSGHEEGSVAIPYYSRTMGHLGPVVKPFLPTTAHAVFPIPLPPLWMAWEPLWYLSLLAIQMKNKNTYPTQDRDGYAVVINPKDNKISLLTHTKFTSSPGHSTTSVFCVLAQSSRLVKEEAGWKIKL